MNKFFIAAALFAAFAAKAEVVAFGVHTVTTHFTPRAGGEWNNQNPGVYIRTADDYVFGTLRNSEYSQSMYAAKVFESLRWNGFAVDAVVGAITGYKQHPVIPMLTFGLSYQTGDLTSRLSYLPKPPKAGSAALHLSFEWSLK